MKRTLLVTDDAVIIREIIKDLATKAGWTVVGEASNGQQAIERYAELKPDAVTLDLVMPEYDGLHALHGIMQINPRTRSLSSVLWSRRPSSRTPSRRAPPTSW